MATHRTRRTRATVAAVALVGALAGCTDGAPEIPSAPSEIATESPDDTPTPALTPTNTPTPTTTPTGEATDGPDDAEQTPGSLPAGFPDPETLVGQEAYDERDADGDWHTVVGGEPLDLPVIFGTCFAGGTSDICAYSISGSAPAGSDGTPEPSEAALLLLLQSTGEAADGTPTWRVLDAIIARSPDSPAILQPCEGEEGVAFYPADDAERSADSATMPVAAAWGPTDDVTALVELDPAEVTCQYVGP